MSEIRTLILDIFSDDESEFLVQLNYILCPLSLDAICESALELHLPYKEKVNHLITLLQKRNYWVSSGISNNFQKLLNSLDLLISSIHENDHKHRLGKTDIEINAEAFIFEHEFIFGRLKLLENIR